MKGKHICRFLVALGAFAALAVALAGQDPDGEIVGVCWHDLNRNGLRDAGELPLNGWAVELIDPATFEVLDTCTTSTIDLDGDGQIDPETEKGVYRFEGVAAGDFLIRQMSKDKWRPTNTKERLFVLERSAEASPGFRTIGAGGGHSLAIRRNGSLVAWGLDDCGQVSDVPTGEPFRAVAGGGHHSMALRPDWSIVSWGDDSSGQVSGTPTDGSYIAIAAGEAHSLALNGNGSIAAWGSDSHGQVSGTPTDDDFVAIAAGRHHSLAGTRHYDSLSSWGNDSHGQVSDTPVVDFCVALAAGHGHSLGLAEDYYVDGEIVSWGDDSCGQVSGAPNYMDFVAIAAGAYHSLALRENGQIISWGDDSCGQVSGTPTSEDFVAVAAGDYHSLALREDGSLVSWGDDTYGQVSDTPAGGGDPLAQEISFARKIVERDPITGETLNMIHLPDTYPPGEIAYGPGVVYYVQATGPSDFTPQIWEIDADTGEILDQDTVPVPEDARWIKYGAAYMDGKVYLLSGSSDAQGESRLIEWNPATDEVTAVMSAPDMGPGVSLTGAPQLGALLAVTSDLQGFAPATELMKIDPATGQLIGTIAIDKSAYSVGCHDGQVLVASYDLWPAKAFPYTHRLDAETGATVGRIPAAPASLNHCDKWGLAGDGVEAMARVTVEPDGSASVDFGVYRRVLGDLNCDHFVGQDDLDMLLDKWGEHCDYGNPADQSGDGLVGQGDMDVILDNWGAQFPPPGDIDGDGSVGQSDLDAVLDKWGQEAADGDPADLDGDGTIGQGDLDAVLNNWGD